MSTPLELRHATQKLLKSHKNLETELHKHVLRMQQKQPAEYMEVYRDTLLHVLTLLQSKPLSEVIDALQRDNTGWDSVLFQPFLEAERRDIMNITKPLEVEEGLYTCPKCKSKKTHSYTRQVRSADEPATTFITCANTDCSYKWKIG